MHARDLLVLSLCGLLTSAPLARAADEAAEKEALQQYKSAFQEGLDNKKRIETLESVVKEHPDSQWADDALWVLGEVAARGGRRDLAVQFRRKLTERPAPPNLEAFTCALPVYETSRVPRALYLLNLTGNRYKRDGIKAVPFNPIPMLVHEDLALDYQLMGLAKLALHEYELAAAAAPPDGLFQRTYKRRAERLKETLEAAAEEDETETEDARADATDKPMPETGAAPPGAPQESDEPEKEAEPAPDEQETD